MAQGSLFLHLDCRHFLGEKPCRYGRPCEGCPDYAPMGKRILIIKLDAIGDVARTTPLLPALHRTFQPVHITWLVAPEAEELLTGHPRVHAVLPYSVAAVARLQVEQFDLLMSLDKTPRATAVAMMVRATEKRGFGLSPHGTLYPINAGAEYAMRLGLSDELKFRQNSRTYQEVIFECCGLTFQGEDYDLCLSETEREFAADFRRQLQISPGELLVGLNCGGGAAFANKMWGPSQCLEFVRLVRAQLGARVLLFGAARERDTLRMIAAAAGGAAVDTGTGNTVKQFQALIGLCDVVVTGDSLGMHLALAEKRRTVALFGPTCASEIEMYGRGEKIASSLPCAPCYRRECQRSPTCMEAIEPRTVLAAVERQLQLPRATAPGCAT